MIHVNEGSTDHRAGDSGAHDRVVEIFWKRGLSCGFFTSTHTLTKAQKCQQTFLWHQTYTISLMKTVFLWRSPGIDIVLGKHFVIYMKQILGFFFSRTLHLLSVHKYSWGSNVSARKLRRKSAGQSFSGLFSFHDIFINCQWSFCLAAWRAIQV